MVGEGWVGMEWVSLYTVWAYVGLGRWVAAAGLGWGARFDAQGQVKFGSARDVCCAARRPIRGADIDRLAPENANMVSVGVGGHGPTIRHKAGRDQQMEDRGRNEETKRCLCATFVVSASAIGPRTVRRERASVSVMLQGPF